MYIECGMYLSGSPEIDILKPSRAHPAEFLAVSNGRSPLSSQARAADKTARHAIATLADILLTEKQNVRSRRNRLVFWKHRDSSKRRQHTLDDYVGTLAEPVRVTQMSVSLFIG